MTGGQVAVTGAASGIGRACVELFVERGHDVVAVDVDAAGLAALTGVTSVVGDVADPATSDAMAAAIATLPGRLAALVLNAGVGGTLPLEHPDAIERFDRIHAVDVRGVALGLRAALPLLGPGSAVVATSSVAGLRADPASYVTGAVLVVDGGLSASTGLLPTHSS